MPHDACTDDAMLRAAIREELAPFFAELRSFMDRRISELSAEVHGATQLLGYSEDNLSGQLVKLHEQVARVVAAPNAATRNSGMELEAVVQTTEIAANRIMEAAEAIADCVRAAIPDRETVDAINSKVDAIFEACSFQDVTGQRVRRAIEHLQYVEASLTGMMAPAGAVAPKLPPTPTVASTGPDRSQAEIDAMFA